MAGSKVGPISTFRLNEMGSRENRYSASMRSFRTYAGAGDLMTMHSSPWRFHHDEQT